jgi:hypothetical protein
MQNGYNIPADIYDKVHETMLALVNASQAGDDVLYVALYEQFRDFCEQQTAAGRGSGFLWEALAEARLTKAREQAIARGDSGTEGEATLLLLQGRSQ